MLLKVKGGFLGKKFMVSRVVGGRLRGDWAAMASCLGQRVF